MWFLVVVNFDVAGLVGGYLRVIGDVGYFLYYVVYVYDDVLDVYCGYYGVLWDYFWVDGCRVSLVW